MSFDVIVLVVEKKKQINKKWLFVVYYVSIESTMIYVII